MEHSFWFHKSYKHCKSRKKKNLKRTEKNGTFLLKNGKKRNVPNGKERGAQPCYQVTFILVKKLHFFQVSMYNPWQVLSVAVSICFKEAKTYFFVSNNFIFINQCQVPSANIISSTGTNAIKTFRGQHSRVGRFKLEEVLMLHAALPS